MQTRKPKPSSESIRTDYFDVMPDDVLRAIREGKPIRARKVA